MIYLLVTYKMKPGMQKKLAPAMAEAGVSAQVKAMPGNRMYDYFLPTDGSEDTMILVECWESKEALDAHVKAPYRPKMAEIKDLYVEETNIQPLTELAMG